MTDNTERERFAQLFMTLVRDRAITACDQLAQGTIRGPSGERWRSVIAEQSAQDALLEVIPEIVDETLFAFFDAVDNEALPLWWEAKDGSRESLKELGGSEMAGRFIGGDWPERHSAQRFRERFPDLRLDAEREDA